MKVWLYVEGVSDKKGLESLLSSWQSALKGKRIGLEIIPLDGKSKLFQQIGRRAAEKLVANNEDVVAALPDLYPNVEYHNTPWPHQNMNDLKNILIRETRRGLEAQGVPRDQFDSMLQRFYPSAFKYDFEMLLLAAKTQLKQVLGDRSNTDRWRHPVEDQNHGNPPKKVVGELFQVHKKTRYLDTKDAPVVLGKVQNIADILWNDNGQLECPVFRDLLDWLGDRSGIKIYTKGREN